MKFLVVGLGNPGMEYDNTRHNIGFNVVDVLAKKHGGIFVLDRGAHRTTIKIKGKTLVLIKPTTYMNLSGKAVNYWLQKEGVSKENLLVVTDDLALPFGKIRLKGSGSDGGHNGLKDITAALGTANFWRLRLGIGHPGDRNEVVNFVLKAPLKDEQTAINQCIDDSLQVLPQLLNGDFESAMLKLHTKK